MIHRNIKLTVAYDGTNYHGFQRQANSLTIQQVLEDRLTQVFGHKLRLTGAARTDAGVHAYRQTINFLTTGRIPVDRITWAAKSVLPSDIVVIMAEEADINFHARYDAQSKIYTYRINNSSIQDPFLRNYSWHVAKKLDVAEMQQAAQVIVGAHDFSAFRAANGPEVSPVREIIRIACTACAAIIEIKIHGTGFLYHMVRNIAGTLLDVGLKKLDKNGFAEILAGRDRRKAGITAPAQGLYLAEVFYQSHKKTNIN